MTDEPVAATGPVCPRCATALVARTMRTAIWQGDRVAIVEDIPAQFCAHCNEQYYDDPVSDALRRLAEDGFPAESARSVIEVPVFSMAGRIRGPGEMPEDAYVD